jgi:hypothetical protein
MGWDLRTEFKHPPIFADVLTLCQVYMPVLQNFPKPFRMSVGQQILDELAACVRAIVLANAVNKTTAQGRNEGAQHVRQLRASVEVVRAFLLMAWKLKYLSHGVLADLSARLEAIARQAARWGQWFAPGVGPDGGMPQP